MPLVIGLVILIAVLALMMRLGNVRFGWKRGDLLTKETDSSQVIAMAIMADVHRPFDSSNGQMRNLSGH